MAENVAMVAYICTGGPPLIAIYLVTIRSYNSNEKRDF